MRKIYMRLVTACGCSRVVENPVGRLAPDVFKIALPPKHAKVQEMTDPFDTSVFPRVRVFEISGGPRDIGRDEWMYDYKEIEGE